MYKGQSVLENLILKPNALDELNLPIQLIFGHLSQFSSRFWIVLFIA